MPKTLAERLREHKEDFTRITGKPFQHFFCPILGTDEAAGLCMAHVVNEALGHSSKAQVVQRQDVDNWFGSVTEADFQTVIRARETDFAGVLFDYQLNKNIRPRVFVNGEEVGHYLIPTDSTDDVEVRGHTRVRLPRPGSAPHASDLVLKVRREEIGPNPSEKLTFSADKDCRIPALASIIKAAHLTMVDLLGYRYSLSAAGRYVGHQILGRFFMEYRSKGIPEARKSAKGHFRPYRHMMRLIELPAGEERVGTVDDGCGFACYAPSGHLFAYGIVVRANDVMAIVLIPTLSDHQRRAEYEQFMVDGNEELVAKAHAYNRKAMRWELSGQQCMLRWSKNDPMMFVD
jgi:hypothetical protein